MCVGLAGMAFPKRQPLRESAPMDGDEFQIRFTGHSDPQLELAGRANADSLDAKAVVGCHREIDGFAPGKLGSADRYGPDTISTVPPLGAEGFGLR